MSTPHEGSSSFTIDSRSLRNSCSVLKWGRFLLAFGDTVRSLSDPEEIEGEACALLCEALGADRVVFLEIAEAENRISVARDANRNNSNSAVGKYVLSDFTWAHEIWSQARCIVIEDTQRCDLVPEHARAALAAISVIGALAVPVFKGSTLVGALCANVGSPRAWSNEEVWLLDRAAVTLWATILQARTASALHTRSIQLEHQSALLRRLATELTLAEHNTRQLLSKTLHDGVQQFLVASKFALDSAITKTGPTELLLHARKNLIEAIDAARSLSVDLFPPVLHNSGLPEALEWLATWMHKKYGKEVTVEAHAEADPGAIEARILIFESVRELIFNSVKHANTAVVLVRANVTPNDEVYAEVCDDGDGFVVCDDFNATSMGHSLGLVAIRERLKILGGSMVVDSSPGHGCRVRIQVPRHPGDQERVSSKSGALSALQTSVERPLRVLIVDDHQICRDGVRNLLSGRPELRVVGEAADGAEALEKVAALEPDIVLMDVSMPVFDGIQATAAIKRQFPKIKVFGLSIETVDHDGLHPIQRAGASGYFRKDTVDRAMVESLIKEVPPPRLKPPENGELMPTDF